MFKSTVGSTLTSMTARSSFVSTVADTIKLEIDFNFIQQR